MARTNYKLHFLSIIGLCVAILFAVGSTEPNGTSSSGTSTSNVKDAATIKEEAVRGPKPIPSSWDGITPEANAWLKENARDYNSVELMNCSPVVAFPPDSWAQRVKFRARNGFGGMNVEEKMFIIRNGAVTDVVDYSLLRGNR